MRFLLQDEEFQVRGMTIVMDLKDYTLTQFLSDSSFRTKMAKIWSVSVARLSRLRLTKLVVTCGKTLVAKCGKIVLCKCGKIVVGKCGKTVAVKCGKPVAGKCCQTLADKYSFVRQNCG